MSKIIHVLDTDGLFLLTWLILYTLQSILTKINIRGAALETGIAPGTRVIAVGLCDTTLSSESFQSGEKRESTSHGPMQCSLGKRTLLETWGRIKSKGVVPRVSQCGRLLCYHTWSQRGKQGEIVSLNPTEIWSCRQGTPKRRNYSHEELQRLLLTWHRKKEVVGTEFLILLSL